MTTDTKSETQKQIEAMAPDQLDNLRGLVNAEADKRAGPASHVQKMSDYEFREYSQSLFDANEREVKKIEAKANAERRAIFERNKYGANA